MEDMREPGVNLGRVRADVGQLDEFIHCVDAGKNDVELGALNIDIEEIDRLGQKAAKANGRYFFNKKSPSSIVTDRNYVTLRHVEHSHDMGIVGDTLPIIVVTDHEHRASIGSAGGAQERQLRRRNLILPAIRDHQVEPPLARLQRDKLRLQRRCLCPTPEGCRGVGYPSSVAGPDLDHGELYVRTVDCRQQVDPLKIVLAVLVRVRRVIAISNTSPAGLEAIGEVRVEAWNGIDEVALQFVRDARSHEIVVVVIVAVGSGAMKAIEYQMMTARPDWLGLCPRGSDAMRQHVGL